MKKLRTMTGLILSCLSIPSFADCVSNIDNDYLDRKMQFATGYEAAIILNCNKLTRAYDKAVCSNSKLKSLDAVSVQSIVADLANQQKWDIDEDQTKSLAKKEYQFRYKKAGKTPESICKFLLKELKETQGG